MQNRVSTTMTFYKKKWDSRRTQHSNFTLNRRRTSFFPLRLPVELSTSGKMALTMHFADASPPCSAALMTASYLGIELNLKKIDILARDQFKPEFLKINPQHSVPVLDDNGFYLAESRAVLCYMANAYAPDSPVYPKDSKERAIVDRMLYFDIGTLFKAQGDYLFGMFRNKPCEPEKNELFKKALALFEGFLSKTPYAAGDHVTIADFSLHGTLTFAQVCDYSLDDYPNITNWIEKIKSEVPNYSVIDKSLDPIREFVKAQKK